MENFEVIQFIYIYCKKIVGFAYAILKFNLKVSSPRNYNNKRFSKLKIIN